MRVLIGCERSGIVREAFAARGHDAWSCDLEPSDLPGQHIQDDVLKHLDEGWDLAIFHPECTYLTLAGNRWMKPEYAARFPERARQRQAAADFFMRLVHAPIERIAVENPIGIMSRLYRKPDQIVQPYWFGDPERKATCLWLKGLPLLVPTKCVEPDIIRHASGATDSRLHFETLKLPKAERARARSRTFKGIAQAMATQWAQP